MSKLGRKWLNLDGNSPECISADVIPGPSAGGTISSALATKLDVVFSPAPPMVADGAQMVISPETGDISVMYRVNGVTTVVPIAGAGTLGNV